MKKFITFVIMLCLCVGMIIPTQAVAAMTVSAEAATVAPGEKFAVSIAVDSNPGFAYLKVQMRYDEDLFEFHAKDSVSNSDALIFAAGESLISWDAGANYSENGTIGKLYFTASDSIEAGEYTIEIDVVECYNIDTEDVQTVASDLKIDIQISEDVSTIDSADMVLGTDITVNYYAKLDASHIGAQMRFTMNGVETLVDGEATGNGNEYVFAFSKVAPQCMGDNIKAELILGETVLDVKEEYSVKTYCTNTLAKSAAQLEMSEEKYAALRTLIADMLEYGAKAQVYKGYKTNALVNEGIEGKSGFVELTDTLKYTEESSRDEIKLTSVGVYFDYANSIYIKFLAPELTEETCYIAVYNETADVEYEYALSECELLNEETGEYCLVLDPTVATGYGDKYIIELYAPRSASSSRLTSVHFVEYSISSYVYSMQNKTDVNGALTPMAELARATYNYGLSASAYNSIAN